MTSRVFPPTLWSGEERVWLCASGFLSLSGTVRWAGARGLQKNKCPLSSRLEWQSEQSLRQSQPNRPGEAWPWGPFLATFTCTVFPLHILVCVPVGTEMKRDQDKTVPWDPFNIV